MGPNRQNASPGNPGNGGIGEGAGNLRGGPGPHMTSNFKFEIPDNCGA